jgi:hypothetical protein
MVHMNCLWCGVCAICDVCVFCGICDQCINGPAIQFCMYRCRVERFRVRGEVQG